MKLDLKPSELVRGLIYKGEIVSEEDPKDKYFECIFIDQNEEDIFVFALYASYSTSDEIELIKQLTCEQIYNGDYPESIYDDCIIQYYKEDDKIMNYFVGEIKLYDKD